MKEKNFQPEHFVLRKFHGFDTVHAKSVSILNLFVERNSTEVFKKGNDHLFALLTVPTIQKTVRMVAQHFPNVELSEIVLERKNSDTKIHRTTCYFGSGSTQNASPFQVVTMKKETQAYVMHKN